MVIYKGFGESCYIIGLQNSSKLIFLNQIFLTKMHYNIIILGMFRYSICLLKHTTSGNRSVPISDIDVPTQHIPSETACLKRPVNRICIYL